MEMNGPLGILSGFAVLGLIVGAVIWDSYLTFRGALELALQNPLVSAPVGLLFLWLVLFGKGGVGGGAEP